MVNDAVEEYAAEHTTPAISLLSELSERTYANTENPGMLTGIIETRLLQMLMKMIGAKNVLEIGTFTGYSALAMAQALPEDGIIYTCDVSEKVTKIGKEFWNKAGVEDKIKLKLGPALETIAELRNNGFSPDFVFIDADKSNYTNYWEGVLPMMKPGGLIVLDNVLWSGRVLNPKSEDDKAIVHVNKIVRDDPRVEQVMLTIRDGVTIARIL